MSQFNGMSKIELEMQKEEIKKLVPVIKNIAPEFAELTVKYYDEYKKYPDLSDGERIRLAVHSVAVKFGFSK